MTYDGKAAQTWNLISGLPLARQVLHPGVVKSAVFAPSGHQVVTWTPRVVKVWDPTTGRECFAPLTNPVPLEHVEFSPDGSRFATCGAEVEFTKCAA